MGKTIELIVRLIRAGEQVYARKWSFLGVFLFAFFVSVIILGSFDLLPDSVSEPVIAALETNFAVGIDEQKPITEVALPINIEIAKIGLAATVANPTTTTVAVLDQELLSGAVRYPTSAKLGEIGAMVLFGHSSYLPVVNNRAYKTFNGIQKLVAGDIVIVSSSNTAYTYRVRNVAKRSADNAGIELTTTDRVLILSTCDSFGTKSDRFVVTADFVESHAISS